MNNEWKELDIYNLPPDILVGDYEFGWKSDKVITLYKKPYDVVNRLRFLNDSELAENVYYRPCQPEQPSHEEIMTKWWLDKSGNWERVIGFAPLAKRTNYRLYNSWVNREYFFDLESSTIPPEVN